MRFNLEIMKAIGARKGDYISTRDGEFGEVADSRVSHGVIDFDVKLFQGATVTVSRNQESMILVRYMNIDGEEN